MTFCLWMSVWDWLGVRIQGALLDLPGLICGESPAEHQAVISSSIFSPVFNSNTLHYVPPLLPHPNNESPFLLGLRGSLEQNFMQITLIMLLPQN